MNKYVLFAVVALLAIAMLRRRGQSVPPRIYWRADDPAL